MARKNFHSRRYERANQVLLDQSDEAKEARERRRRLVTMLAVALVLVAIAFYLAGCVPPVTPVPTGPPPTPPAPATKVHPTNPQPQPSPDPTPTPIVCEVSTPHEGGTVNVRGGPGMTYPVVAVVVDGERLTLTGQAQPAPTDPALTWSEVYTPAGVTGWFICDLWCRCEAPK